MVEMLFMAFFCAISKPVKYCFPLWFVICRYLYIIHINHIIYYKSAIFQFISKSEENVIRRAILCLHGKNLQVFTMK